MIKKEMKKKNLNCKHYQRTTWRKTGTNRSKKKELTEGHHQEWSLQLNLT